jgi:hypothetical protein
VAEALAYAPARIDSLIEDARARAIWRAQLGLAEPSPRLTEALDTMGKLVQGLTPQGRLPTFDMILDGANEDRANESALELLVRQVLRTMLEVRRMRQPG